MRKWILKWHKATEELPEESGNYLVCREFADGKLECFQEVSYSKKHLLFNAYDSLEPENAKKHAFNISNLYWSEFPKNYEQRI